ncbi:chromosomal replication initiator protein DnaA [Fastidiosibacter lacustris]|uniref:chromosomal replication initiator protein DnaA n=1 Tax=Fastidiosibacter lacustris TaxID=2056695 RepID=UPI000E34EFA4|nr:chromosomal replication initiator protein DnaA [Fastidiosibacter lacustris]
MSIWQECLDYLKNSLSEQEFRIWIMPLKVNDQGNLFTVYAPNNYFLGWIKTKYQILIVDALKKHKKNELLIVDFSVETEKRSSHDESLSTTKHNLFEPFKSSVGPQTDLFTKSASPAPVEKVEFIEDSKEKLVVDKDKISGISSELYGFDEALALPKEQRRVDFGSPLKKEYNFDNFVVGKANEVARAAAMQVSINPGLAYNPLFIYGGSGLGKTHLMHAIGNYVLHNNPTAKVLYVTSERFVKDYVDAVRLHSGDEFQNFYRSVDVLLVDDIQFIAGKAGSQEEFFHTFNTLLENGKQVVLSCDKYPKEIPKLEERLVSRFGYGLTVTIDIPDLETRSAILLHKSSQFGRPIDQNVALFMAKHIRSNVRELEGALRRVLNYAQFNKKAIDEKLAYECLKDVISIQEKIVKVDNIQRVVADYYNIKITDLLSKQKSRDVARPRQVAMALAKEFTNHSLPEIGSFFGGRDHTTVLHAVRTIQKLLLNNVDLQDDYQNLSRKLAH